MTPTPNKMLITPWETVFVNDRMVKHEVRAFLQEDETRPSYRDVIVNFFRKPHVDGTDKKLVEGEDGEIIEQTVYWCELRILDWGEEAPWLDHCGCLSPWIVLIFIRYFNIGFRIDFRENQYA